MQETDRIEQLEAENFYLKSLLETPATYPREFNLTPNEVLILNHLHSAKAICSEPQLRQAIGYEGDNPKLIHVYIYWLRKKLGTAGIYINQTRSFGYYLDRINREQLKQAIINREMLPTRHMIEQEWKSAKAA